MANKYVLSLSTLFLLCIVTFRIAEAETPLPGHQRSLQAPLIEARPIAGEIPARISIPAPPSIDGVLDELVWKQAIVSQGFWCSLQEKQPSDKTEVLVLADENYLYFGFRMYDDDPEAIQSITTVRDVGLGYDDSITIELDTFFNRRDISEFSLNPSGTQSDEIAGGRSSKIEWKGDWLGAATRTQFGWSAEFAIPFDILNYKTGDTIFGLNFVRYQSRTKEHSYWADVTPQVLNEEMGQLTGLVLPPVDGKKAWTFMPYLLAGKDIPDKKGKIEDTLVTAGIDMRYQPRPNLTGMFAANPDFSQVEEAVTDISFSYTEKAVADNRPFFIEGGKYFSRNRAYFYSNRVPDFDIGAKGFGRLGRTQFGLLATRAPDDRNDFVGKALYEINETNSASATLVSTMQPGFDNLLAVAQFGGRQPSGLNYSFDAAFTDTSDVTDPTVPEDTGSHYKGSIGWKSDYFYIEGSGDNYDTEYFPANALLDSDLPGTKGASLITGYYQVVSHPTWRVVEGYVGTNYRETDAGKKQQQKVFGSGSIEFNNDVRVGAYVEDGTYRPVTDTRGVFEDNTNDDRYYSITTDFNTRSNRYSVGLQYDWGDLGGASYEYYAAYGWLRPVDPVYLSLSAERTESFGTFDQLVLVGSWSITPEHSVAARYIYSEDDNDDDQFYRLAYGYRPRKGLDIFAVYDDDTIKDAEYSIKLVKTF